jgi:hypothetical protein
MDKYDFDRPGLRGVPFELGYPTIGEWQTVQGTPFAPVIWHDAVGDRRITEIQIFPLVAYGNITGWKCRMFTETWAMRRGPPYDPKTGWPAGPARGPENDTDLPETFPDLATAKNAAPRLLSVLRPFLPFTERTV